MFKVFGRRLVEATKIHLGARPSTVRFDALDKKLVGAYAYDSADILTRYSSGLTEELESLDEDHERFTKVAAVIQKAIERYVRFPKAHERRNRRQMNDVPSQRTNFPV